VLRSLEKASRSVLPNIIRNYITRTGSPSTLAATPKRTTTVKPEWVQGRMRRREGFPAQIRWVTPVKCPFERSAMVSSLRKCRIMKNREGLPFVRLMMIVSSPTPLFVLWAVRAMQPVPDRCLNVVIGRRTVTDGQMSLTESRKGCDSREETRLSEISLPWLTDERLRYTA
jgi:hypothetical protein